MNIIKYRVGTKTPKYFESLECAIEYAQRLYIETGIVVGVEKVKGRKAK